MGRLRISGDNSICLLGAPSGSPKRTASEPTLPTDATSTLPPRRFAQRFLDSIFTFQRFANLCRPSQNKSDPPRSHRSRAPSSPRLSLQRSTVRAGLSR